ncbi:MAG: FAD-binding and (Fe-S)-binding domain-containing protein [Anaeromyxobacter sp.]
MPAAAPSSLAAAYAALVADLGRSFPAERIVTDPLRRLAMGTDASFYRLVPEVVVKVRSEAEVAGLLTLAAGRKLPVTFRAAGTSLSGQAVSDSILAVLAGGFTRREVLDGGARVRLEPGVIGAEANALLAPLGRKLGPDPASIGAAMLGGIAANNASGMCCGTAQNSYQTLDALRLVLWDGTVLDTGDAASRAAFAAAHPEIPAGLAAIRDEVRADAALADRIRRKYRIKNTTGYGLNAFVDFDDPIDILAHLLIGSEGTLAFISELTLRTVEEHAHKASALVLYADIAHAARAVQALDRQVVSAAEIMDRASIRSVEAKPGMPPGLAALGPDACALLVEVRSGTAAGLPAAIAAATDRLSGVPTLAPAAFTTDRAAADRLWDVRRGLFPAVGAARRIGTTVVIEDVAFPMEHLAAGTLALQEAFRRHGYAEGIIFGHALDGNLHFTFTQDFGDPREVDRYARFLDDVCEAVVNRFDGSLKAEHGTGRNMAPFVEKEWGSQAHGLMRRVKALLDPHGILNPGVILNDDPKAHLQSLKPLPAADPIVDRCIECGFCEPRCPSRNLSATPRQRIVVTREMARLRRSGEDPARLARLSEDFRWWGEETCATDGLCATACPVGIDTGVFVKGLRAADRGGLANTLADGIAGELGVVSGLVRIGLGGMRAAGLSGGGAGARPPYPGPAKAAPYVNVAAGQGRKVVYLPACVSRTFGATAADPDDRALPDAVRSILAKAGFDVVFPDRLETLCCGLAFESKGFPEQGNRKARELERALLAASEHGALPILCDTSPCLQRMRKTLDPRLVMMEPAEFIHDHCLDRLAFTKEPGPVALHVTCSSTKMGLAPKLEAVARRCAEQVVVPAGIGCCGFAGDRGFSHPELNAAALAGLPGALPPDCKEGFSNSRTCELGLTHLSGRPYRSIAFLVDRCTRALPPELRTPPI